MARRQRNVDRLKSQDLGVTAPYIHERLNMMSVTVVKEDARSVRMANDTLIV